MMGQYKIIFSRMSKQSRNKAPLCYLNGIKFHDVKAGFSLDNLSHISFHQMMLTVNFGSGYLYVSTSSIIKSTRLENGLSRTIPAIDGSSAPYIRLVTAPIERPHRPIQDMFPSVRK
ncbi:Os03g0358975 [Oryza sativa Japonica Group]|uniref:Os03g0358975 protein n=1 Tax=Oryza sativa subsp. japonica TaxID=39947 RepID=A0A0P0VXP4_ORYSJ|nr:Os03g0358975 [Oryza sativa Japonica Group]